jgi:hypothetical protein
MLPPVEEDASRGVREAQVGSTIEVFEEDEYDIPAFLRRNAE